MRSKSAGPPFAGHRSTPVGSKHGSCFDRYTCSPSASRVKVKVEFPRMVARPLAEKESVLLSGVRETSKVGIMLFGLFG